MSAASTSGGVVTKHPTFSFPFSLRRLFLRDCNLEYTDSNTLSFSGQPYLQYLNLGNTLFEFLPYYDHLNNLRVLDLSLCSRLRCLLFLPITLAELYIYYCKLLEKITFQSRRFNLQEFGYEGCIKLYEVEGFINLVPIAKLDETELGHMKWLKEYQNHEVCLVGDDELTVGRSWHIQNKMLKGINVILKYAISGDDGAWFCKVSTTTGVDLMYNPIVFGKPEFGKVCIWLSYWPIGNTLEIGDTVNISIVVMSGLEVLECGVSLVYSDQETVKSNMGWEEILGGDLSGFQLSTGAYYLCRRDFFELMEVGRLTPDWFRILVGDTIDYTEVRGWRKTGRPKQVNPSFTELKTVRCVIDGPELEDVYKIEEMSKLPVGDKTVAFTSSLLEEGMKTGTRSEYSDEAIEV
ncbi:hypothetical protein E3N88_09864 [Mikania micrantha]|uniref:Uncharacterized protein n=1 Tax=Mikania micrantha TaxID=192012 RepID=A0A5N6PL46_9ASTR|nr:hypothetical protein E3N88_09864 [Mikania micrantha]